MVIHLFCLFGKHQYIKNGLELDVTPTEIRNANAGYRVIACHRNCGARKVVADNRSNETELYQIKPPNKK